jgi:hypothetical protein
METLGVMTFVASSLPPSPTSSTTTSALLKCKNASAVANSKKVHGILCSKHRSKSFQYMYLCMYVCIRGVRGGRDIK